MRLLVVGGGFTGSAVALRAKSAGWEVQATTRSEARAAALASLGVVPLLGPALDPAALAASAPDAVLVTVPPVAEQASLAAAFGAVPLVYISSTAMYGASAGVVDERTPLDPTASRAAARVAAEEAFRAAGAVVLRCPGIYGPGRGMHLRVARGEARIAGDGAHFISRIHVDDLASFVLAALERHASVKGRAFVVGDDEPAPQGEVVRWLAARLGVAEPPAVPLESVDETLRGNRRVDNAHAKATFGVRLAYPTYREGFAACIAADRLP
jgi:nucleoside-diphosphate-sugar epimerase